ncbi:MAG TPA: NADH-quinone oxidoreductase subunit NuoH [Candidatus Thermoplasmatota archaeon]|nr:NADH-quinone oxidoreductase subunit NuoH [Candidatus Thermoplasmatota archaeon]
MADPLTNLIETLIAPPYAWFIGALLAVGFVLGVGGIMSYVMRKIMARIQTRLGPNRVGPFGLLQFLADGIKFMSKEDVIPSRADPWGFRIAPYLAIVPIIVAFVPLPFSNQVIVSDLSVGILFILAISAVAPIGEIVAGWASNNKYSMYGAMRAAALDVAYEIPLILSAIAVVMLAGTMSTTGIALAQHHLWFILLQPLGALIFFVAALAKAGVVPTDLPESESELVAGYFTEYSGMKFGVFFVGVLANIVFISALTVLLYFGGWTMPFLPTGGSWLWNLVGILVFLAKVAVFVFIVLATWFTLPRVRADQFLSIGWKVLFPLSVVNLVVAVAEVYFLKGGF